jgi:hypothetical protein
MKQETKIQLLPFEIELLSNAELILTKNALLQKLKHFLEDIQLKQQVFIAKNASSFPEEVIKIFIIVRLKSGYKWL